MSTNKSAKAFVINFEGDTELLDRAFKNAEKEAQKLGGTLTNSFIKSSADGKKFTAQVELLLKGFKDLAAIRNAVDTEVKIYRNGAESIKAIRKEEKDAIAKLDAEYAKKVQNIASNKFSNDPAIQKQKQDQQFLVAEAAYQKKLETLRKTFADRELASINADKALKAKE